MTNKRQANGARRRAIVARIKAGHPRCWICGRPIDYSLRWPDPWSFVVDEAIPIKYGGSPTDPSNCKPAHAWCNRIKSTHSIEYARKKVYAILNSRTIKHPQKRVSNEQNRPSEW